MPSALEGRNYHHNNTEKKTGVQRLEMLQGPTAGSQGQDWHSGLSDSKRLHHPASLGKGVVDMVFGTKQPPKINFV